MEEDPEEMDTDTPVPPTQSTCWCDLDISQLLERDRLTVLYNNAQQVQIPGGSKEDRFLPLIAGHVIPDFEEKAPSKEIRLKYIKSLSIKQAQAMHQFVKKFPSSVAMTYRVAVMKALFVTMYHKYHNTRGISERAKSESSASRNSHELLHADRGIHNRKETDMLMEMTVKTLMTFMFSLLRMSWSSPDLRMGMLCADVLTNCSEMMTSVPALSLANESRLPSIAVDCLGQIMTFVTSIMESSEISDPVWKQCACHILLGLALQRGTVNHILNWISVCLNVTLSGSEGSLSKTQFKHWLHVIADDKVS